MAQIALLNAPIPAAGTYVGNFFACRDTPPQSAAFQANFAPGTGGTSATFYVQTSTDGQKSWVDAINFAFTTSAARQFVNLSALTPITTLYTATDGALTSNTCKDGLLGQLWRVKYVIVGAYTGATIRIDGSFNNSHDTF